MATRADIRDAFMSELRAVSGTYDIEDDNGNVVDQTTLDQGDIGLRDPEYTEPLPAIVYHEDYREVDYNGVGTAPSWTVYNQDGSVDEEHHREYIEAQFIIDVRASDEAAKEPIYEALHSQFGKYQFDPWDEKDLHGDVLDIDVIDAISNDSGDTEDVIRGDQLEVRVTFYRNYVHTDDNITSVGLDVDADSDGTDDDSYTTT